LNIENDFGSKLYLEPPYIKAERGLLNIMLNNAEAFEYIANNFDESELIIESHKKIYTLIKDNIEKFHEELIKFIETNCDDVESSKEWVIICETQLIYDETDWQRLADDFIREIRKFKLEESKKEIMNKIKLYENEGRFEECIKFSQQLQEIQKKLGGIV
jgi:DNA primase